MVIESTLRSNAIVGEISNLGGGIDNVSRLTIIASTLSGNSAQSVVGVIASGGGLYNGGTLGLLKNTIVAGNSSPTSPTSSDVAGSLNSMGYNLIGIGAGGSGYADSDLVGTAANPIDPMSAPCRTTGAPPGRWSWCLAARPLTPAP